MESTTAWDPNWETIHQQRDWGFYPSECLIKFIARNFYKVPDRSKIKILELGFGTGGQIWYLCREGFDVYGIEGSKTAVDKCHSYLEKEGQNANLRVGDILTLDYPDDFFDAVLDVECYTCIRRGLVEKINDEVSRVLKPNGVFFSQTLAEGSYIGDNLKEEEDLTYNESTAGDLVRKRLVRLTRESDIPAIYRNFKDIKVEKKILEYNNFQHSIQEWIISGKK